MYRGSDIASARNVTAVTAVEPAGDENPRRRPGDRVLSTRSLAAKAPARPPITATKMARSGEGEQDALGVRGDVLFKTLEGCRVSRDSLGFVRA